jgi:hypothetical protein
MIKKIVGIISCAALALQYHPAQAQAPCQASSVFGTSAYTSIPAGVFAAPTLAPGYYQLSSNITITGNCTFTNAIVLISPGVTITVANNAKLTLDKCHLFTCPTDNKMWAGIVLASGASTSGQIEVRNNTLIEDANAAITAFNCKTPAAGAQIIKCDAAIFNRNRYAIDIENYAPTGPAVYPFSIENTVFTSRNLGTVSGYPLAWMPAVALRQETHLAVATPPLSVETYAMANCKDGGVVYQGILLNKIGYTNSTAGTYSEIQIGNSTDTSRRNLFDNTGTGITAINANLTSYNNWFIRMYKPGLSYPYISGLMQPTGIGIDAGVGNAAVRLKYRLRVLGTSSSQPPGTQNRFYECVRGINIVNYWDATCNYSLFQTANTGFNTSLPMAISITNISYHQMDIDDNKIYNMPMGIKVITSGQLFVPTTPGALNIYNNVITAQPTAVSSPSFFVFQGMLITTPLASTGYISPTAAAINIYNNTLNQVYNGIAVSNHFNQKANIYNNTVNMSNYSGVQYGISYANSKNGQITGNYVSGIAGSIATNDKARGVYLSQSLGTKVCDNHLSDIGRGFDFANSIAQTGTTWTNNSMNNHLKAYILGSDIGPQSIVSSGRPPKSKLYACNNIWNGTWGGGTKFQTFVENHTNEVRSPLYVRNLPTEYPTFHNAFPSTDQYYNAGLRQGIWRDSSLSVASCYSFSLFPMLLSPLSSWLIADSMGYDSTRRPQQWLAQYSLYQAGLSDSTLADSSDQFARFMNAAAGSRYAWLSAIGTALANADIATAQSLMGSPVAAMGRVAVDTDVVITDYTEANYVVQGYLQYYGIYLHYLQAAGMSAADTDSLVQLAARCPALYGGMVGQARALLSQVTEQYTVYDDDDCMNTMAPLYRIANTLTAAVEQNYTLYPNPNNGSFVLRQSVVHDAVVPVRLYDAMGRLVWSSTLSFVGAQASLQVPHINAGSYILCINDAGTTCLRFTVK